MIIEGKVIEDKASNLSLLDLDGVGLKPQNNLSLSLPEKKDVDVLCDVFSSANVSEQSGVVTDLLLPVLTSKSEEIALPSFENKMKKQASGKFNALEELDILSEHLLKENLQSSKQLDQQFNK